VAKQEARPLFCAHPEAIFAARCRFSARNFFAKRPDLVHPKLVSKLPSTATDAGATPPGKAASALNTRAAGIVGLAVLCSRLLGLARELLLARLFGAGMAMDAFKVAFRIPNLLRDLFAEGALSTAFVTVFSKKIATGEDASAWALANKVATLATVVLSAVVLAGMGLAPLLVGQLAGGFAPEKAALTVLLTQIMFPFILLVSLSALVMGLLNAKDVFGAPAMASSFFNIGSIVGGIALAYWLDPLFGPDALIGLSVGTLIGGGAQWIAQFPALRRVGYRFRPDFRWSDEGVRHVLRLMGPAVVAASAVQINVMINSKFASHIPGDGPVSWLDYAFRLMQLPLGIFGVAIGTVTLPLVSRHAANGDTGALRSTLARGLRLGLLLTVPSTVGLICLADPIISLIYESGKFDGESSRQTAAALRYYALGLAAYSGIKVLAPAFYAIDRRTTPMLVSFGAIGVNLLLNWLFTFRMGMGHCGLALSTGCVALANFLALYVLMRSALGAMESRQLLAGLARILAAGAVLSAVCVYGGEWVGLGGSEGGKLLLSARLGVVIAAGATAFFACAQLLGVAEMDDLLGAVRRRLRR
jgi:putative peptidoglycan lipid II flippase